MDPPTGHSPVLHAGRCVPPPVGELVALLVNAPPYGLSVRTVPGLFQVHPVVPTPSGAHSSWAREREGDRERVRQRVGTGETEKG